MNRPVGRPRVRPRRLTARERAAILEEKRLREIKKKRLRRIKWLGSGILLSVLIYSFSWHPPNRRVPYELEGKWQTEDDKYADRWFDIDSVLVDFGTGGATVSTGFIKEVAVNSEPNRTLYTISYQANKAAMNQVSFYYEPAGGGTIRFTHQENIAWKKQ
jgi:hypothetical protein